MIIVIKMAMMVNIISLFMYDQCYYKDRTCTLFHKNQLNDYV